MIQTAKEPQNCLAVHTAALLAWQCRCSSWWTVKKPESLIVLAPSKLIRTMDAPSGTLPDLLAWYSVHVPVCWGWKQQSMCELVQLSICRLPLAFDSCKQTAAGCK